MKKLTVLVLGAGASTVAFGAGFGIYEASARGNAMGGAVVGDTKDATAAYYNPANIAFSTNIQVATGLTFIKPYCDVDVDHKSQGRMNPGWFAVPTFYATIPLPFDTRPSLAMCVYALTGLLSVTTLTILTCCRAQIF